MTTFDDICHTYMLRAEGLDLQAAQDLLAEFCRRWPEHSTELREFAATDWRPMTDTLEIDGEPETPESRAATEVFVQRGMEVARKLIEELRAKGSTSISIEQ